jgi:hypothetical protein
MAFLGFKTKKEIEKIKQEEQERLNQLTLDITDKVKTNLLNEKMNSSVPWYEIIDNTSGDESQPVKYRWNKAFINDLISKGYKGNNDEELFNDFLNTQRIIEEKRLSDIEYDKKRKSDDPWVEVVGEVVDDDRVSLQLDWNDAFIKYLKRNNFKGANEDIMVQKWLESLERDLDGKGEYLI